MPRTAAIIFRTQQTACLTLMLFQGVVLLITMLMTCGTKQHSASFMRAPFTLQTTICLLNKQCYIKQNVTSTYPHFDSLLFRCSFSAYSSIIPFVKQPLILLLEGPPCSGMPDNFWIIGERRLQEYSTRWSKVTTLFSRGTAYAVLDDLLLWH